MLGIERVVTPILISALLLTGCAMQTQESSLDKSVPLESQATPSFPAGIDDLPAEWTKDEMALWDAFSNMHYEAQALDLESKRSLIAMTHKICDAYKQGFTRLEIESFISARGSKSAITDDLMTLGVKYVCPEHMDAQPN